MTNRVTGSGRLPGLLGRVGPDERGADHGATGPAKRLGRHQLLRRLDDGEPRQIVAAVEGEPGEDLAAEVGRADAVPREPEAVVHAPAAPEDRQVRGRDVDRPAPGVRDPTSAKLREEAQQVVPRGAGASGSTSSRARCRAPNPIRPPPQPNAIRPSRVVRR